MYRNTRPVLYVIGLLSLIAFFDATYLTIEKFMGYVPPCSIAGCELVLSSNFSRFFAVPLSLIGAVYYLALVVLTVAYLDFKKIFFLEALVLFSAGGFVAASYFIYLQAFVLESFCTYCMVADISALVILPLTVFALLRDRIA